MATPARIAANPTILMFATANTVNRTNETISSTSGHAPGGFTSWSNRPTSARGAVPGLELGQLRQPPAEQVADGDAQHETDRHELHRLGIDPFPSA